LPPENPFLPAQAVIKRIKTESADVGTFTLVFSDPQVQADYRFRPGQYNMVSLPGIGEAPISISSSPNNHAEFDHTIRFVGRLTNVLSRLKVGDKVGIRGPYGKAWPLDELKGKDVAVIIGGTGCACIKPAINLLVENRTDYNSAAVFYGAKNPPDLLFADEFEYWQNQGVELNLTVDKGRALDWPFHVGVVTTLFDRLKPPTADSYILIAGPEIMMRFSVVDLIKRGFRRDNIYLSLERRMDCALGMCGHCQLGPKYVCREGPVFTYQEIEHLFGVVA
jgi:sulfhydrogenase subunit gamma (sulfur reductase)